MDPSNDFSLAVLSRSDTALRRGLDNTPNAGEQDNLIRLRETLLGPACDLLGVSLHVNSGFRSPAVNQALGGATGSAHMDGRAADVVPIGLNLQAAFDALRMSDLAYDQIILECNAWIHLAIARTGVDPRREALTATGKPGAWKYVRVSA